MFGHAGHRLVGIGDRFQAAILSVRSAGLEGHHVSLPGGVHDGQRHLEAALVHSMEDFQADADALLDAGALP